MIAESVPAGQRPDQVERFGFESDRGSIFSLWLKNLFLSVITLGVYRFWARTSLRRMFWSMVSFRGSPLEYTGTGKELFIGFLVAMVVLLPIFSVFNITLQLVQQAGILAQIVVYGVFSVLFGLLGILGRYLSRRYLLTRTRWRNIQAGQDKAWRPFFAIHFQGLLAAAFTLGLALPWAQTVTYNFRMGITRFGTGRFAADADASPLFRAWLPAWALLIGAYALLLIVTMSVAGQLSPSPGTQGVGSVRPPAPDVPVWLLIPAGLAFVAGLVLHVRYLLTQFCHFANHTRFETMALACTLPGSVITRLAARYIVVWLIMIGVGGGVGFLAAMTGIPLVVPLGVFAAIAVAGMYVTVWVYPDVLKALVTHLEVRGPDALDDLVNRGHVEPRRGEGLADALGDVGLPA